ncbi:MAG: 50S ribosomal protein L15 [Rhodospirillaceae bacterium]|jgi:large subunit ribosomal protein L15|nr:50S ribosomal protein L15 [Rhodospirillaceae bacterium]MBT6204381.1 50S ribosomal protein L15 [Rhodospirillaceae bacterium]MBT6513065.1 50S ribosomal protein L15 [Rhodospirillaceae bacterium]MBT7614505.1 50S ribosomal protein L15 [Rhodospirillaceae bacterium]
MKLNDIRDNGGATHYRKRRGRGIGSGLGKTGGRGHKGQNSRSGVAVANFEGGQMPIYRRLPMRGFKNPNRRDYIGVNIDRVQLAIDEGKLDAKAPIDAVALKAAGVIKRVRDGVRLLGRGELKAKINITVAGATKTAVAAVEGAGGSITMTDAKPAAEEAASDKAE